MSDYYSIFNTQFGRFLYCYNKSMELQYCKWIINENEIPSDMTEKKWIYFEEKLNDYFNKKIYFFDLQLNLKNTKDFTKKVLLIIQSIPPGKTVTYSDLANKINNPKAQRAIGRICRNNPFPIVIPCHRVTGKNGLGGYGGAKTGELFNIKVKLLDFEKQQN